RLSADGPHALRHPHDGLLKFFLTARLKQVFEAVHGDGLTRVVKLAVTGQKDDLYRIAALARPRDKLQSTALRHFNIAKQDIHGEFFHDFLGGADAVGAQHGCDAVTTPVNALAQPSHHAHIVVHN